MVSLLVLMESMVFILLLVSFCFYDMFYGF